MRFKLITLSLSLLFIHSHGMESQIAQKSRSLLAKTAGIIAAGYARAHHLNIVRVPEKLYAKDFERLGVRYLNHLEIQVKARNLPPGPFTDTASTRQYGTLIEQRYHAPVYLQYIDSTVGYGVFAQNSIAKDQMIGEYTGILKITPFADIDEQDNADYGWAFLPNGTFYPLEIDAQSAGNFTRFVNHSFDPNVGTEFVWAHNRWHLIYKADSDIQKDQQLLVNYGTGYWENRRDQMKPVKLGLSHQSGTSHSILITLIALLFS